MSEGRGVAGVNLWSWGGEGRPLDHRWWVEGDPLTGDPPHEVQGKYTINKIDFNGHVFLCPVVVDRYSDVKDIVRTATTRCLCC